ncbi:glutathione reductase (NADPH) [Nematocida ausubeli]|nr:glutathione reductase (NADPH) [Nematocida ausubeli]
MEHEQIGNSSLKGDEVLIVNGGSFGERLKNLMKEKGIKSVETINTQESMKIKNRLYQVVTHSMASALDRVQYYTDYSLRLKCKSKVDWKILREKIKKRVHEIEAQNTPEDIYSIEKKEDEIWINNTVCKAKNIVIVNSTENTEEINMNNLWIKLVELESTSFCVFLSGSGKQSVETASILSDLGCKVYLSLKDTVFLPECDTNIQEYIKNILLEKGVTLFFESTVEKINELDRTYTVTVNLSNGASQIVKDIDYYFTEREYSLEIDAVQSQRILSISEPGKNIGNAEVEVLNTLFPSEFSMDKKYFPLVPTYIYTSPPAAAVGYTEAMARKSFPCVRIVNPKFRGLFYSVCQNKVPTDYKLVFASDTAEYPQKERLVGLHLFGTSSIDAIKGFSIGMHCGISPEEILKTIPIHPTSSEEIITG